NEGGARKGVPAWAGPEEAADAASYAAAVALAADLGDDAVIDPEQRRERARQGELLRDILGNPFRPLRPRLIPPHVLGLAQVCYAAFPTVGGDFLVLADALDDLGEGRAAAHCREALHVKGCHVLDWIMGKD